MTLQPKLVALREAVLALLDVGEHIAENHGDDDAADAAQWRELMVGCTRTVSLEQLQRDYLVRWNEGTGAAVEAFWREVARRNIAVSRKQDVVLDTLRRGRVLSPDQFYELEDHFEELQACGKLTSEQAEALNKMLDKFESKATNFQKVRSRI